MAAPPPLRRPAPSRRLACGWGFVAGVALVTAGVLLQLPDLAIMLDGGAPNAGDGMPDMTMWTPTMTGGMLLLVLGLVLSCAGLFRNAPKAGRGIGVSMEALAHGRLRPAHWLMFAALTVALIEDIMKPLTLGFVLPGMSREYGMSLAAVSALPVVALTGTAVGSVVWGLIGDRYGRRTALLLATLLFVATAACGAMPSFGWNLVMCFAMGCSAGGLLPLALTLVAELTPRRHRGWTAVLLGAVGGLGGYLAASTAATYLEPLFGWRVLWLIGLPSGLVLLAMMPLVPESPLYLLRVGRRVDATAVLLRFGSQLRRVGRPATAGTGRRPRSSIRALISGYPVATAVVGSLGMVWGLVNFGFLVMLPSQLREGMTGAVANGVLARSALYSAPALGLVVLLYAFWAGRRTLALFMAVCAGALLAVAGWSVAGLGDGVLVAAVGALVLAQSAVSAMLVPYSAEIYPTGLRATGTGLAAAATKFGGILGPSAMVLMLGLGTGLLPPALILAGLCLVVAVLMVRFGPETGGRKAHSRPGLAVGEVATRSVA